MIVTIGSGFRMTLPAKDPQFKKWLQQIVPLPFGIIQGRQGWHQSSKIFNYRGGK
jgi:hypothetical protein